MDARSNKAKGWLYPEEEAKLLGHVKTPLERRALWGFLAREGLRLGEALALTWEDLDLERGALTLDKNKTDDPRAWALDSSVTRALAAYKGLRKPKPDDIVFQSIETPKLAKALRADLKAAGVNRAELSKKSESRLALRVHDLRGTFVTLALASGRTETWVADRTGHKSSIMINTYRRAARSAAELGVGTLVPLDQAIPEFRPAVSGGTGGGVEPEVEPAPGSDETEKVTVDSSDPIASAVAPPGLEPGCPRGQRILSPPRLPVPPGGLSALLPTSAAPLSLYGVGMQEVEAPPQVLCIGGTDPTGAAGLFLDQRVLAALGVYGAAVVTAVTVQTSRAVSDVVGMPASVVGAQLDAAIEELGAPTIKVGMLHSLDIVQAVAGRVRKLGSRAQVVLDPVFVSSSGRSLLAEDGRRALLEQLVPLCALVTPNRLEAEALTGERIFDLEGMGRAADLLLAMGASAVLVKGGHLEDGEDRVVDLLRTADGDQVLVERSRILGPGFRGSGCFLATAIAALLAEGAPLAAAVELARGHLDGAMRKARAAAPHATTPLLLTPIPNALAPALPVSAGPVSAGPLPAGLAPADGLVWDEPPLSI